MKYRLKKYCWLLLMITQPGWALYLDSGVFTLESDQTFTTRQVLNNTQQTNLYTISAYRIDKPGKNEKRLPIKHGELLYAPLRKLLMPNKHEFVKLYYQGPQDAHERYYRVVIRETPVNGIHLQNEQKNSVISPVVALDTVLVVRPRKMTFRYNYDAQHGKLTNTGNTYFQLLLQAGCQANNNQQPQEQRINLLPGEYYQHKWLKGDQHRKFIVAFNRYHRLGNKCESK